MSTTTELPPEIQEALLALDRATDEVASRLKKCAEYVNSGQLSPDAMMLKMHGLQAKLMGLD